MPERIGEEVSEETRFRSAKLIRRRTVRPKYAADAAKRESAIAPLPRDWSRRAGSGWGCRTPSCWPATDVTCPSTIGASNSENGMGSSFFRPQMVQWAQHIDGPGSCRCTMGCGRRCSPAGYLQVDETPVKVLDPEVRGQGGARVPIWFYAVVRLSESCHPGVRSQPGAAAGAGPLEGLRRHDPDRAYDVYEALRKRQPDCSASVVFAHSRRRFYAAARDNLADAVWFITQIRRLYQIEAEIRDLPPDERYRIRQEWAPAIWQALKARAEELKPRYLPQSTLGQRRPILHERI